MDRGREEQRLRLRSEAAPGPACAVLRGGPDTVDKLRTHAQRTARAWSLDGVPLFGVSVFCALDDIGPASIPGLADSRLRTYRRIHVCLVGELTDSGIQLLPTGNRPHFTAVLRSGGEAELVRLLATLGPPHDNRDDRPFDPGPRRR